MNLNFLNDKDFIQRLTEIVEANFKNESFGVSDLVKETGLSHSLIHRRLKSVRKQTVSLFIREIRLNKAKQLLEEGELTVSEIAYEVGFGSPSYFIKCFHEKFGYAPGEYVKNVGEPAVNKSSTKGEIGISPDKKAKRKYLIFLLSALILILAATTVYFLFYKSGKEPYLLPSDKSIAILPLKNSGNDPEVQQLADGIVEDILTRLSHVGTLNVKSRNSSAIYRNTSKSTPEIAKELGVSYLAEGTILKDGKNIRIYIQLIDAVNDRHLWSEQYDKDLSGIFDFISGVSIQIAKEMETVLTKSETEKMEKLYTRNPEAYKLYQKGRFFYHRRTEEDMKLSIDYYNRALKIDSSYSLAWAGLADNYFISTWWGWIPETEGIEKSKTYALRALSLHPDLAEAHAVLGGVATWFDYDWDAAERELKKAIEINPNFAIARQYYAEYLRNRGRFDESIHQFDLAIETDPNIPMFYGLRSASNYYAQRYKQALDDLLKEKEFGNRKPQNLYLFRIYVRLGNFPKAIEVLKEIMDDYYPADETSKQIDKIYSGSGINGIIRWLIEQLIQHKYTDSVYISSMYALLNDWDSALKFLDQQSRNTGLWIKYSPDFKPISNDPRFLSLMKKWDLEDL